MKASLSSLLRRYLAAMLLVVGLFVIFYAAAYRVAFIDSDYAPHGRWAMMMSRDAMIASFYDGSERLWHILVRFLFDHILHDLYRSMAAVTALADAAAFILVFAAFDRALPEKHSRTLLAAVVFAAFIASALTVPGGGLYAGAGGLNTWHNPTNIMVRPFAAAVFYMTAGIYNRRRCGRHSILAGEGDFTFSGGFWRQFREPVYTGAELVLYPLCILLSVYSKPSFLQFFGPAILLFLLIDVIRTKGMLLPFCVKLALSYLPAAFVLLAALKGFFPSGVSAAAAEAADASGGAGISVYFLRQSFEGAGDYFRAVSSELLYFLRPCAFPLLILILGAGKTEFRTSSRLAAVCLIAAFAETWFLHETGSRADHGNFLWGSYLASWLAWTVAAGEYTVLIGDKTRRGRLALYAGTPLLLWHVCCGITYLVLILRDGHYFI